jgi:hypothetical protein
MGTSSCRSRVLSLWLSPLLLISAFVLATLNGCGTLPNGRGWGQDATMSPGWKRLGRAAMNAALSPETWAPVAAAVALQVDDMDERISDWASEKTPIFGSREDADRWGSYLRDTSGAAYLVTALATPSGDDPSEWSASKVKGLAVGAAAWGLTLGTTEVLKRQIDRTRPDKSDERSFPSGHASTAGTFTTLARRNLQSLSLPPMGATFAHIGLVGIAAGTAWARIEAKEHYPSDVLVGYALGHFFSAFMNDAFLGLDTTKGPFFTLEPSRRGVMFSLNWAY